MYMKKRLLVPFILAGLLTLTACNNGETIVESDAGNISEDEFYNTMKERYGETTLKELVYKQVLADQFEVTDKELEEAMSQYKDMYGDNFEMFLMQLGIESEEAFKDILEFSILQEKAAMEKVDVTDEELKEQYNIESKTVSARHILVETEDEAKKVLERLNNGEDFAKVAKEVSTDTTSAEKGGDVGEVNPDQFVREFTVAAYQLEKDEISEPVQSQYGYHIIQATEVKAKKDVKSFEEMKPELTETVKQTKITAEIVQEAMDDAVEKANIKINDKDLKDIFKKSEQAGSNEKEEKQQG